MARERVIEYRYRPERCCNGEVADCPCTKREWRRYATSSRNSKPTLDEQLERLQRNDRNCEYRLVYVNAAKGIRDAKEQ